MTTFTKKNQAFGSNTLNNTLNSNLSNQFGQTYFEEEKKVEKKEEKREEKKEIKLDETEDYCLIDKFKGTKKELLEKKKAVKKYLESIKEALEAKHVCSICHEKDVRVCLGTCGHTCCEECVDNLETCHMCATKIDKTKMIKLFFN